MGINNSGTESLQCCYGHIAALYLAIVVQSVYSSGMPCEESDKCFSCIRLPIPPMYCELVSFAPHKSENLRT